MDSYSIHPGCISIQCDFGYRTLLGNVANLNYNATHAFLPFQKGVRWPWKGQREAWWQGRRTRGCVTSLDGTERGGTGDDSEPHHGLRPRVEDPPPSREFFAEGTSRCNSLNVKRLSSTCLGTKRSLRKMERPSPSSSLMEEAGCGLCRLQQVTDSIYE